MKTTNIKQLIEYLFIAIVLVTSVSIPIPVSAAGTAVVSVSAPTQAINSGTQFTVNINVQPNNAIAGIQYTLSYNPALVTVNSVSEGNLLKQNGASTYFTQGTINNTTGTLTGVAGAIITPGQTVSSAGTFATITFTAGTTKGNSSCILSSVIVGDINGQALTVSLVNGQVSIDHTPVLAAIGNKTVNEGAALSFTTTATDADGDSLTYAASNLPTGAVFNSSSHNFSWTPTYSQAGSYPNIHFQVSDGSLTASEDITITVNNVNRAPVLTAVGNKTANESSLLSFSVTASDPDGDALTYSASNLPSGAGFNTSTQLFTWTPTHSQIGTYPNVSFQVSDGTLNASENITITVASVYAASDVNMDGSVNVLDLTLVTQHFSETGAAGWIRQDTNGDGVINVLDCIVIGQHWSV
jgi:hypothetical protein